MAAKPDVVGAVANRIGEQSLSADEAITLLGLSRHHTRAFMLEKIAHTIKSPVNIEGALGMLEYMSDEARERGLAVVSPIIQQPISTTDRDDLLKGSPYRMLLDPHSPITLDNDQAQEAGESQLQTDASTTP